MYKTHYPCPLILSSKTREKKRCLPWLFYEYTEGKAIILSDFPAVSDHVTSCQHTASHSKLHTQERLICIRAPCEVSVAISEVSLSFIVKGCSVCVCVSLCVYTCARRMRSQVRAGEFGSGAAGPVSQDLCWSGLEAYLAGLSSLDSLRGGWVCLRKPRKVLHCLKTQL